MSETARERADRCIEAIKDAEHGSIAGLPGDEEAEAAIYAAFEAEGERDLLRQAWANLQALHDLCPPGLSHPECGVDENPDAQACVRCWAAFVIGGQANATDWRTRRRTCRA